MSNSPETEKWRLYLILFLSTETTGTTRSTATSPTETDKTNPVVAITASTTQTLTEVPTEIHKASLPEKAAGFEAILAIAILLALYIAIWKRR